MKEIPILFSTPMVQAILDLRKLKTRRVITQHNSASTEKLANLNFEEVYLDGGNTFIKDNYLKVAHKTDGTCHRVFSRIAEGDILWVRETWCDYNDGYSEENKHLRAPEPWILYKADCKEFETAKIWRPSIFMPKTICRIWLQVTKVRSERLHQITEEDAVAEGVNKRVYEGHTIENATTVFKQLWQHINGTESWETNPWVWVIEFKVLSTTGKPNIQS